MKSRKKPGDLRAWCAQIQSDDCINPREIFSTGKSRTRTDRKGQQLCKQVFRALSIALGGECRDTHLQDLEVLSVELAPDVTHLLVTVRPTRTSRKVDIEQVLQRLLSARSFLRGEIAATITRRRAPDLSFRVAKNPEVSE